MANVGFGRFQRFLGGVACLLAFSASAATPVRADEAGVPVAGTVLGADGSPPPAGARAARMWSFDAAAAQPLTGYESVPVDGAGRFTLNLPDWSFPAPVLVVDAARKRGALAVVPRGQKAVTLRLKPLVPVRYRIVIDGWNGAVPPRFNITVGPTTTSAYCLSPTGATEGTFLLPPGEYAFRASSGETETAQTKFAIAEGRTQPVDLGTLRVPLSPLARRYGKPAPPLTVTDAQGVPVSLKLADLRGKWVFIDFWGFWCPPCVQKSLPDAIRFWEEHAGERDRFTILTFHCLGDADTIAKLQPALRALERDFWKRPLPFPILMDASEKTIRDWGITLYPSTVLIDPEGNVVKGGSLELLAEKLAAERKARR